jgi:hypothetical protein
MSEAKSCLKLQQLLTRKFEIIAESARQLAVSAWFIKDLLRKGKLRAKKVGRRTVVSVRSRRAYASSLPDAEYLPPKPRERKRTDPIHPEI